MPYKDPQKRKAHKKLYYQKNKDLVDAKNKKWRDQNIEKDRLAKKRYYSVHKKAALEASARWKERNPLKVKNGQKEYRIKNREKILKKQKLYRETSLEIIKESNRKYIAKPGVREKKCLQSRIYRRNHPELARAYVNERLKTDIQFKLRFNIRHRLYLALKGKVKRGSAVKDLGCSIIELKDHLEKKFKEGMTWQNWAVKGWHIDHIKPLDSFDLTDRDQLLKAVHFTNLQPLWAIENIKKGNKMI